MRTQFKITESFVSTSIDRESVAAFAGRVGAANERALDAVVDANRRLAQAAVTSADRVAEVLPVALPFADKLPTPAESAERYIDFVERAAAVNREFNQRIMARLTVDAPSDTVVETVTERVASPSSTKTAATKTATTKKATAKKATAKKAAAKRTPAKKAAAKKAAAKKAATTSSTTAN